MSAPPRDWFAAQEALADILRDPVLRPREEAIAEARRRHPHAFEALSATDAEFVFDVATLGVKLTHGSAAVDLVVGFVQARDDDGKPDDAQCDRVRDCVRARYALQEHDEAAAIAMANLLWNELTAGAAIFIARVGDGWSSGVRH